MMSIVGGKYTRDAKLRVLEHYFRNGGDVFGNKQATANKFNLDSKTVFRFLQVPELVALARRRACRHRNTTAAAARSKTSPVTAARGSPAARSLADVPLSDSEADSALLEQTAADNLSNVAKLIKVFDAATPELRDILLTECELVYECRVCRSLFRSVAQLLAHKRRFCRRRHQQLRQPFGAGPGQSLCLESAVEWQRQTAGVTERRALEAARNSLPRVLLEPVDGSRAAVYQTLSAADDDAGTPSMGQRAAELARVQARARDGATALLGTDGKLLPDGQRPLSPQTSTAAAPQPEPHRCPHCNTEFSTRKTLSQHVRSVHSSTRIYFPCPCCSGSFTSTFSLERHLQRVHKKKQDELERLKEKARAHSFQRSITPSGSAAEEDSAPTVASAVPQPALPPTATSAPDPSAVAKATNKMTRFEWKCRVCDGRYQQLTPAIEHVQRSHPSAEAPRDRLVRVCRVLRTRSRSGTGGASSLLVRLSDGRRGCLVCRRRFPGRQSAREHLKQHGQEDIDRCLRRRTRARGAAVAPTASQTDDTVEEYELDEAASDGDEEEEDRQQDVEMKADQPAQLQPQNLVILKHELLSIAGKGYPVTPVPIATVRKMDFVLSDADGFACTLCEQRFDQWTHASDHMTARHSDSVVRAYVERHAVGERVFMPRRPSGVQHRGRSRGTRKTATEGAAGDSVDAMPALERNQQDEVVKDMDEVGSVDTDIEAGAKLLVSCRLWNPTEKESRTDSSVQQNSGDEEEEEQDALHGGKAVTGEPVEKTGVFPSVSSLMLIGGQAVDKWEVMRWKGDRLHCAICLKTFTEDSVAEAHLRTQHTGEDIGAFLNTWCRRQDGMASRGRPLVLDKPGLPPPPVPLPVLSPDSSAAPAGLVQQLESETASLPVPTIGPNTRILKISRSDLMQRGSDGSCACLVCDAEFVDARQAGGHMRGHSDDDIRQFIRTRGREILPALEERSRLAVPVMVAQQLRAAQPPLPIVKPAAMKTAALSRLTQTPGWVSSRPHSVSTKEVTTDTSEEESDAESPANDGKNLNNELLKRTDFGTQCLLCSRMFNRHSSACGHIIYHSAKEIQKWRDQLKCKDSGPPRFSDSSPSVVTHTSLCSGASSKPSVVPGVSGNPSSVAHGASSKPACVVPGVSGKSSSVVHGTSVKPSSVIPGASGEVSFVAPSTCARVSSSSFTNEKSSMASSSEARLKEETEMKKLLTPPVLKDSRSGGIVKRRVDQLQPGDGEPSASKKACMGSGVSSSSGTAAVASSLSAERSTRPSPARSIEAVAKKLVSAASAAETTAAVQGSTETIMAGSVGQNADQNVVAPLEVHQVAGKLLMVRGVEAEKKSVQNESLKPAVYQSSDNPSKSTPVDSGSKQGDQNLLAVTPKSGQSGLVSCPKVEMLNPPASLSNRPNFASPLQTMSCPTDRSRTDAQMKSPTAASPSKVIPSSTSGSGQVKSANTASPFKALSPSTGSSDQTKNPAATSPSKASPRPTSSSDQTKRSTAASPSRTSSRPTSISDQTKRSTAASPSRTSSRPTSSNDQTKSSTAASLSKMCPTNSNDQTKSSTAASLSKTCPTSSNGRTKISTASSQSRTVSRSISSSDQATNPAAASPSRALSRSTSDIGQTTVKPLVRGRSSGNVAPSGVTNKTGLPNKTEMSHVNISKQAAIRKTSDNPSDVIRSATVKAAVDCPAGGASPTGAGGQRRDAGRGSAEVRLQTVSGKQLQSVVKNIRADPSAVKPLVCSGPSKLQERLSTSGQRLIASSTVIQPTRIIDTSKRLGDEVARGVATTTSVVLTSVKEAGQNKPTPPKMLMMGKRGEQQQPQIKDRCTSPVLGRSADKGSAARKSSANKVCGQLLSPPVGGIQRSVSMPDVTRSSSTSVRSKTIVSPKQPITAMNNTNHQTDSKPVTVAAAEPVKTESAPSLTERPGKQKIIVKLSTNRPTLKPSVVSSESKSSSSGSAASSAATGRVGVTTADSVPRPVSIDQTLSIMVPTDGGDGSSLARPPPLMRAPLLRSPPNLQVTSPFSIDSSREGSTDATSNTKDISEPAVGRGSFKFVPNIQGSLTSRATTRVPNSTGPVTSLASVSSTICSTTSVGSTHNSASPAAEAMSCQATKVALAPSYRAAPITVTVSPSQSTGVKTYSSKRLIRVNSIGSTDRVDDGSGQGRSQAAVLTIRREPAIVTSSPRPKSPISFTKRSFVPESVSPSKTRVGDVSPSNNRVRQPPPISRRPSPQRPHPRSRSMGTSSPSPHHQHKSRKPSPQGPSRTGQPFHPLKSSSPQPPRQSSQMSRRSSPQLSRQSSQISRRSSPQQSRSSSHQSSQMSRGSSSSSQRSQTSRRSSPSPQRPRTARRSSPAPQQPRQSFMPARVSSPYHELPPSGSVDGEVPRTRSRVEAEHVWKHRQTRHGSSHRAKSDTRK